jgi:hypothetical protein
LCGYREISEVYPRNLQQSADKGDLFAAHRLACQIGDLVDNVSTRRQTDQTPNMNPCQRNQIDVRPEARSLHGMYSILSLKPPKRVDKVTITKYYLNDIRKLDPLSLLPLKNI